MIRARAVLARAVGLIVPVLLVIAWQVAVQAKWLAPSQSAAPSEVAVRLGKLLWSGGLFKHALYSLGRLLAGVFLGTLLGILSSLSVTSFRAADRLFSPTLQFLAGLPVVVWMPFWIMFFGTGEGFKISMTGITAFFLVHGYAVFGMRSLNRDYMELAEMYEKSHWNRVREVLLPSALPTIMTALRVTFALGWVVIFFVEYASASQGKEGLGWFIADARGNGMIEEEFAGLICLAILAFSMDSLLAWLQRRLLVWNNTLDTLSRQGAL